MSSVALPVGSTPQAVRRYQSVEPRPIGIASNSIAIVTRRASASGVGTGGPAPSTQTSPLLSGRQAREVPAQRRRAHDLSPEGTGSSGLIVSDRRPRSVAVQSASERSMPWPDESHIEGVPIVNCSGSISNDRRPHIARDSSFLLKQKSTALTALIARKHPLPGGQTFHPDGTTSPRAAAWQNQNILGASVELASAQPSKTSSLPGQAVRLSTFTTASPTAARSLENTRESPLGCAGNSSCVESADDHQSTRQAHLAGGIALTVPSRAPGSLSSTRNGRTLRSGSCGGESREFDAQASIGHDTHRWTLPHAGLGALSIATVRPRPETDKGQCQDFREEVATMRKDLETHKAAVDAQRIEVGMLHRKFDDLSRKVDDMFASIPRRLSRLLQDEQETRTRDMESLRAEVNVAQMSMKLNTHSVLTTPRVHNVSPPCAGTTSTTEEDASNQLVNVELPVSVRWSPAPGEELEAEPLELQSTLAAVPQMIASLQEERISTRLRLTELHSRLQREVAAFGRQVQCIREQSEESLILTDSEFTAKVSKLEELVVQERRDRGLESVELRAILESVWNQVNNRGAPIAQSQGGSSIVMASPDGTVHVKQSIKDSEDVLTLYDMVQEALGNQVRLFSEIEEERKHRYNQINAMRLQSQWLQRQVDALNPSTLAVPVLGNARHTIMEDGRHDSIGDALESEILEKVDQHVASLVAAYVASENGLKREVRDLFAEMQKSPEALEPLSHSLSSSLTPT